MSSRRPKGIPLENITKMAGKAYVSHSNTQRLVTKDLNLVPRVVGVHSHCWVHTGGGKASGAR